jgi:hypothetical protein
MDMMRQGGLLSMFLEKERCLTVSASAAENIMGSQLPRMNCQTFSNTFTYGTSRAAAAR